MKIVVAGVTGMVGQVMTKVLEERKFPITEFIPCASERSVGKKMIFNGKEYEIISVEDAIERNADIALFSMGGAPSKKYAPLFAAKGTVVIDNSSTWRMDATKKLIVPEINGDTLTKEDKIIANPNCSTIQMVMALAPLHEKYNLKRIVVSTYQSITGTGVKATNQLSEERNHGKASNPAYPHQIDLNCLPHCDIFLENDYTKEEMKLVHETKKILGTNNIGITATAVRVPVMGGHSESINVEFVNEFVLDDVIRVLKNTDGVVVQDNPAENTYPMPFFSKGKDEVFVGRIRRDESQPKTLNLWVVADNLRKGAATNTVQIAEIISKIKSN